MANSGTDRSSKRGPTVSVQEARVFLVMRQNAQKWLSSHEIAAQAPGVAMRTVRAFMSKYARLGIVEVARVFPGHRYRLKEKAAEIDSDFFKRMMAAMEVFGLEEARLGTVGQAERMETKSASGS